VIDASDRPDRIIGEGDNNALALQVWGDPDGHPVVLMHGMPGSRLGPRPRGIVLERMGVRLISYDRPGYGYSARRLGRKVADSATDVERIVDFLKLDRFAVAGRSGGGPHALACAAVLGDRVERVALLVSAAPIDAAGLQWDDGLAAVNVDDFADIERAIASAAAETHNLRSRAEQIKQDPESLIRFLSADLHAADRRVVEDRAMRNLLAETYAEAVRQGAAGWFDDAVALRSPWDFKFDSVECPVLLWHGDDDRFAPAAHTRWLAKKLRDSRQTEKQKDTVREKIESGVAHFAAFEIFTEVLDWLIDPVLAPAPSLARTAAGRLPGDFEFRPAGRSRSDALGQSPLRVG
jgi:pimeloyl-ACP methyl ester carboxylesterase